MKITYDKKADSLAVIMKEDRISRDMQISENVFAGFNRAGELIELQFLDVSERESPWLTLEAAAHILHISTRTLMRWIKSGKIKPAKIGHTYRIKPDDLKKWAS